MMRDKNRGEDQLSRPKSCNRPKVLIVGINYSPEPTGIAPYSTAIAADLLQAGAQVTVCTGVPHYPSWKRDFPAMRLRRTEFIEGAKVLRLRHFVPRRQTALSRALYELTFLSQITSQRWRAPFDVIVGVTPALAGAIGAARLANRYNVPLVLIIQDMVSAAIAQSGIGGGPIFEILVRKIETTAISAAKHVIIATDSFRPRVLRCGIHDDHVHTVPNWTRIESASSDRSEVRANLGWPKGNTVVLHSGNMGLKQDLDNVLQAARLLSHVPSIQFVLQGDGSQRRHLEKQAESLPNVQLLGEFSTDEYPKMLDAADIFLVNERSTVIDMCLPSKLTSYFAVGRPVVAAVRSDSGTAKSIQTANAGMIVEPSNPHALASAITALSDDPPTARALGNSARLFSETSLRSEVSLSAIRDIILSAGAQPNKAAFARLPKSRPETQRTPGRELR